MDAQEYHKCWRHMGLAELLWAAGDVCWCPEGHCGDVPVLEGQYPISGGLGGS